MGIIEIMLNVNQLTALSEANAVNSVLISGTSGGFIIINDKEIKAICKNDLFIGDL
ncbi:MAG: hypothetical protein Q9M50_06615 [Methylococcales bacterium]|nr:hypothetical protein [Methylococcales bacterium]